MKVQRHRHAVAACFLKTNRRRSNKIDNQRTELPKVPQHSGTLNNILALPRHLAFLIRYPIVAVKCSTLLKAVRLNGGSFNPGQKQQ